MKITSIKAKNWLGKGDFNIEFSSDDNIESIIGANASGKTLLLRYIFDISSGRKSPYMGFDRHFDSLVIEYDNIPAREYIYDEKNRRTTSTWKGSVPELPISYLGTHAHIKIDREISDELIEKFNKWIKKMDIGSFKFIRDDKNKMNLDNNGERFNPMSSGQMQFINITTTLMWAHLRNRKIILIDDIERSMHIQIQLQLRQMISELKPEDCQFIITTHSPDFIQSDWSSVSNLYIYPEEDGK